ncbi:hypothetical protein J8I29_09735 [Labrys sp. LIt4]|uniref:hypothetical protein n=1 Tax=Labrys sp. LIt4 TaxID=2821355 RepID=UPI001AE09E59|nr:hypothetical protein [Labrys sp. LIt4]MBP0579587.1 hypothetical protein [Labrys sp. LIt4]
MELPPNVTPTGKNGSIPTSLDLWRLCDALTVVQAALLIIGQDPSEDGLEELVEEWEAYRQPTRYRTAKIALEHAIRRYELDANIVYIGEPEKKFNGHQREVDFIIFSRTTIEVSDLRSWLFSKGFTTGFFFPDRRQEADYLDPDHPRFAPKLAAAVHAWQAVENPGSKSPKSALEKWLRENAAKHRLTDADGNVNETGVLECAKVANWEPKGGAPKTPTQALIPAPLVKPSPRLAVVAKSKFSSADMDDDIPF